MERPLVQDGERYFCPVLNLALWSLRPAIEAFIKPGSADAVEEGEVLWERYNRSRADYVEEKAVQYLAETLRHAEVYRNLTYQVSENGETKEVELDGLLMIDSALFLVEAKAGTLSPPARRGAPKRIYREIKELVEDAYLQALRAKRYIEQTDSASFSLADGTVVEVARERFDRIFLVTVTLEPMDAFVTMIYQLQDLGLFSEGDLPWAVCLTDLRVISEVIEFPSQLIHYLTRRHRLNELGRIETHDELDWLGHYLCEGLYFEDILADQDESSVVRLLSYTTDLDNYYLYTTGQRKTPAPKPTQPMPEVMRHILTELEAHHPDGYLDAACLLLDMGSDSREAFVEHVIRQRELALQEEDSRDFSMVFSEERFGLTYMFAPSIQVSNLKSRLPAYCQMKKYQTKSNLWVGLGCIVDAPGWAQAGFVFKSPWAFDEEMDKLVTESLPPLPRDQHGDS